METVLISNGTQLVLIPGFYRCDNCGRDVERTQKTRRFRLCDECWAAVVPDFTEAFTEEQRAVVGRYWGWYSEMERRKPARYTPAKRCPPPLPDTDDLFPLCECGNRRKEYNFGVRTRPGGLFGGPFGQWCPVCEAKREVEAVMRMASGGIHANWDDEEWLDHLWRSMRRAFEIGVLPDYWYELKAARAVAQGDANSLL